MSELHSYATKSPEHLDITVVASYNFRFLFRWSAGERERERERESEEGVRGEREEVQW